jgi:hypothetical protein
MTYCGERCMSRRDGAIKVAVTLRCRSWGCDECADRRKKQLIAQAIGGKPNLFITLTIRRHPGRTPESAARELARGWRLLRLRIMRDRKWKRLPFIAVFEPHASGWPHIHILLRSKYIDQAWLSTQWLDITKDSFKIDIRRTDDPGRSAGYCAKYCGKGTAKFGTCKRYWQSADYDLRAKKEKPKFEPGFAWEREDICLSRWCRAWTELGYSIVHVSHHEAHARPPP